MVTMPYEWPAGKWLFQGLMASVVSGVGFVFLTLVFEYGKRYRRQRREREQQVILEKLLRGDMVLEWNNPQAVVPVSNGCVLRDMSASHRESFLISNYKQRGGFLGVGRGYYAHRNIPEDESTSDTELTDNRISFTKCNNLIADTSNLGENENKTPESAVRIIPSGKTSFPENKDEARIFQNLINSQSTLSISSNQRKESGEPAQKDVSMAHMCKKMRKEMCYRIVKEHPFIAPFIRRDLLQELKEVTHEPKVSNSGASSNVTPVPKKWLPLRQSICRSPTNETTATGVNSMPKTKNRGRSMSRGPLTKMRNTPIQLEKMDSLVQKPSISGMSKNTDLVLSKKADIKLEYQTPNNITGTAHKCKPLKSVKSRRNSSLCQRSPLKDHRSFTQISKLAQDVKSFPKLGAENVKEDTFAKFDNKGSSVDPMTALHTIITEQSKDKTEHTEEIDHIGDTKLVKSLGRENSECPIKQSAQCLSGTVDTSCAEGRINEIVSALTSWGYSIKNKVQGKETESTAPSLEDSVNGDTRPGSDKLKAKKNAKLNSKALIDFIKKLTETRKNRKLLRQISSVLGTGKTTGRLSRNSKSFSKTQIPSVAASAGTSVITIDKTPVRLSKNSKSFSKTQIPPVAITAGTPVITTYKTPVRLSRNLKSFSKTQIPSVATSAGTSVITTYKTPVRLSKISKPCSRTQILSVAATSATPVITTDKTPVRLSKNSKSVSKTQISSFAATAGTPVITTDKTPVKLSRSSKSFSKTQMSPMAATTGAPVIVKSPGIFQKSNDKINIVSDAGSIVQQDIKKSPGVKRRRIVRERSCFAKLASTSKIENDRENAFYQSSVLPSSQSRNSSPPKLENEWNEKLQTPQKRYRKSPKSINLKKLVINKMEPHVLKKNISKTRTRRPNSPIHQEVATERDNLEVVASVKRSKDCSESDSVNPKRSQMGEQFNKRKSSTCNHRVGNEVTDHAEKATQVEEITLFSTPFSDSFIEHITNYSDMSVHQNNEMDAKLQSVDLCITNEAVGCKFSQSVNKYNVQEVRNDTVAAEASKINPVKEKDTISQNRDFILSGVNDDAIRTTVSSIRQRKVGKQKEQRRTTLTRTPSKHSASNKVKKSSQNGASELFSEMHTFKSAQRKSYPFSRKAPSVVKCNSLSKQSTSGYKGSSKKLQYEMETAERHTVSAKTKPKEQQTRVFLTRGQNNNESSNKTRENGAGKAGKQISNEMSSRCEQYQKNKLHKNAPLCKRKSPGNKEVKVELNEIISQALLQHVDHDSETDQAAYSVGQLQIIDASLMPPSASIINTNFSMESEMAETFMSCLEADSRQTDYQRMLDSSMPFGNDHFELHSDAEDVAWGTKESDNMGQQPFNILKKSRLDIVVNSMMNAGSIFSTTNN